MQIDTNMLIREIEYDTNEYRAELELRNRVLRMPLGLNIYDEPLEEEQQQWHFGLFDAEQLIGCTVAIPKSKTHVKIRQMAIDETKQRAGLGRLLLSTVERLLCERGIETIELAARLTVCEFYLRLDYEQVGSEFVEVGIPHIEMRKQLNN